MELKGFPSEISLWLKSIFSKDQVNTGRQLEVDIARGLAVFFMILVHVSGEFLEEGLSSTMFAKVIDFMGAVPAAPVFMFVMGIGFLYSKNQSPSGLFKRGLLIFVSGYILNIARGFLPQLIGSGLGYYSMEADNLPWNYYLIEVDILHFAGLAMMFFAFLRLIKLKEIFYPVIAVVVGIVSPYLWGLSTGIDVIDVFLSTVFGGKSYTFHPFFSWIVYPLMGAFFGWILKRVKDKKAFYLISGNISSVVVIACIIYCFSSSKYDFGIVTGNIYNYFQHGILSNITFIASIVFWLSFLFSISSIIPALIKSRLLFWSKAVTIIYFVHWILIGWGEFIVFDTFSLEGTIFAMIIMTIISDRLADLYIKIRERFKERTDAELNLHLN